jgi:hypothetical protein
VPTPLVTGTQPALTATKSLVKHLPKGQTTAVDVLPDVSRLLNQGDSINVDQQGRASLRFSDALRVEVFHDSKLTIKGEVDQAASAFDVYLLEAGATLNQFDLDKIAQKRVRLATEWAVIEDLGTDFFAHYDPVKQRTWIVVLKGQVEVNAPRANADAAARTVMVTAGKQTWVDPQQPPMPPVPAARSELPGDFPLLDQLTNGEFKDADVLPTLTAAALDRTVVTSGDSVQGTLTLSGAALEAGAEVTLTNSDPGVVDVPARIIVPAEASSGTFTVTTQAVNRAITVEMIAAYGNIQHKMTLTVQPAVPTARPRPSPAPSLSPSPAPSLSPSPGPSPRLTALRLTRDTVEGGTATSAEILLSDIAPANGIEVKLSSSNPQVTAIVSSLTVPAGKTGATFDIPTGVVRQDTEVRLTATYGSDIHVATLRVLAPIGIRQLAFEPETLVGGHSTRGTIILSRAAPPQGAVIALTSDQPNILPVPDRIDVPPGEDRISFPLKTFPSKEDRRVDITARYNGQQATTTLVIQAPPSPTFEGIWSNQDPETRGITTIAIRSEEAINADRKTLVVHMWGSCTPSDCDWGEQTASVADASDGMFELTWAPGYKIETQQLSLLSDGRLRVAGHVHFIDNSGRPDMDYTYFFVRSAPAR